MEGAKINPIEYSCANAKGVLADMDAIPQGQYMTNSDKSLYLVMQKDGNLVLYMDKQFTKKIWSADTAGKGKGSKTARMMFGNLQITDYNNKAQWESGTESRNTEPNKLKLVGGQQKMVIETKGGKAMWDSSFGKL